MNMTPSSADQQERINELESRLALADHAILELSNEVYRQQRKLEELNSLVSQLSDRIRQIGAARSEGSPGDEIPPHY
jgi:SlyX protein